MPMLGVRVPNSALLLARSSSSEPAWNALTRRPLLELVRVGEPVTEELAELVGAADDPREGVPLGEAEPLREGVRMGYVTFHLSEKDPDVRQ